MAEKGNKEFIIKMYQDAQKRKYAIGAFNFSTMELMHGIHNAALKNKAPVIMSNSEGERAFFGREESVALWNVLKSRHPKTVLHADHTKSFAEVKKVIDAGYPSVHFDGSELDYKTNLRETKKCADYAKKYNVFIEAELGGIKGGSTFHKEGLKDVVKDEYLTKPDEAKEFCEFTGIDSLAISVGNAHGIWADRKKLDFERIKAIKAKTGKFLVLHGGSGITPVDFRKAIDCGINKININTETRLAFEKALLKGLAERTDDVPYRYLGHVHEAVSEEIGEKMVIFRAEKKA